MTKKLAYMFAAAVLLLAAAATSQISSTSQTRPVVLSQNPLPACPPFCDEPNSGGGETAKRH